MVAINSNIHIVVTLKTPLIWLKGTISLMEHIRARSRSTSLVLLFVNMLELRFGVLGLNDIILALHR